MSDSEHSRQAKQATNGNTVDTDKDSYIPTARAITEHIGALKKEFGGTATGTPKAKTTTTPKATPKKSSAVKTPKSSAKRKRVSHSSDEDEEMKDDADDDSAAERERLKATPSGPRSTLSRRSKSVAKTYNEDHESEDELATPQDNTRAATPTPMAGEEEQPDFFGGGAFDGPGEEIVQMDGVAAGVGLVNGTLTPQGKTANGHAQANSAAKRVLKRIVKREEPVDDSDGSEFNPDFM